MLAHIAACIAMITSLAYGQSLEYHFTMGVTSPAPVPGKPFTFTWTGGESTEAVYIVLNGYFPETPDQNIIYGTTDILCTPLIQTFHSPIRLNISSQCPQ